MGSMEKKRLLHALICLLVVAGAAKATAEDPAASLEGIKTAPGEKDRLSAEKVVKNLKEPELEEIRKLLPGMKENIRGQTQNAVDFLADKKTNARKKPSLPPEPKSSLFYFFSFSIPEVSLAAAAGEAASAGAIMVMRGLSEDDFTLTARKIRRLTEKSPAEVWIDPVLFECFGVFSVPQIILARDFSRERGCTDNDHTRVRGDVSLSYALSLMEKEDENAVLFSRRIKNNGFYGD